LSFRLSDSSGCDILWKKKITPSVCAHRMHLHGVAGVTGRRESAQFADELRLEEQVSVRTSISGCVRPSRVSVCVRACSPHCIRESAMIVIA